jgi:hypothetical protein
MQLPQPTPHRNAIASRVIGDPNYAVCMFSFKRDAVTGHGEWHFNCRCGARRCERVEVTRSDGTRHATEFVRCSICRALFRWGSHELPGGVSSAGPSRSCGADGSQSSA